MSNKTNIVNIELDVDTKNKLDTLAFLTGATKRDLCKKAVIEYIDKNSEAISEAEKLKAKFKQ